MKTEQQNAADTAPSTLQTLCPKGVSISQVSLQFDNTADEASMQSVDRLMEEIGKSHHYLLGDYLLHLNQVQGEGTARERIARCESPEVAKQAMWVCKFVAVERRLIAPSYSHAREVARLEPVDQEHWLSRARAEGLNARQLRAELRQSKAITTKTTANQAPIDQAASRASQGFEVFRAWYQANSPDFTADQQTEWHAALLPLVTDVVAHLGIEEFERVCAARQTFLKNQP